MPTAGQTALVKLASKVGVDAATERLGISLIAEGEPLCEEKGSTTTPNRPGTA